jgi:hypothetical protein
VADLVAGAALGDPAQAATAQRTRDDDAAEAPTVELSVLSAALYDDQVVDQTAHVEAPPSRRPRTT